MQQSECSKASSNKTELSETAFRLAEKHYKLFRLDHRASKRQSVEESDFSEVIDFHNIASNTPENQSMMHLISEIQIPMSASEHNIPSNSSATMVENPVSPKRAANDESETKRHRAEQTLSDAPNLVSLGHSISLNDKTQRCYTFDGVPGLLFFPAALNDEQQQHWCGQALNRFTQSPPFPNNLTTLDPTLVTERYGGPHRHTNSSASISHSPHTSEAPQKQKQQTKEKLRWATLGFKYNWTTKSYDPSQYCLFPSDLSKLIRKTFFTMLAPVATSAIGKNDAMAVAEATAKAVELAKGLQKACCSKAASAACSTTISAATPSAVANSAVQNSVTSNPNHLPAAAPITLLANQVAASHKALTDEEILSALLSPTYEPQTAIVNYFPVGTMMCAHQDLSEPCLHRPLISLSLGASCVFLMGTTSRDDKPHAFLLRSGDIVAFTGPSRVAFHAVPRVLDDCPEHLVAYDSRMAGLRININVRQVYDEPQPQLVSD